MNDQTKWLFELFSKRQLRNPAYSIRAFARDSGLSAPLISQIFNGNRSLTPKSIHKATANLDLDREEQDAIQKSWLSPDSRAEAELITFTTIPNDTFKLISRWYHFAILSLSDVKGCRFDASWIAERLGISYFDAKDALRRLLDLGIIEVVGDRFRQSCEPLESSRDIPSVAIRKHHQSLLELAQKSLLHDNVAERYFGSLALSVKSEDIDDAKDMLREFHSRFAARFDCKDADRQQPRGAQGAGAVCPEGAHLQARGNDVADSQPLRLRWLATAQGE